MYGYFMNILNRHGNSGGAPVIHLTWDNNSNNWDDENETWDNV